jgi:hypothetical protein
VCTRAHIYAHLKKGRRKEGRKKRRKEGRKERRKAKSGGTLRE